MYHWDLLQSLQDLGGWTNPLLSNYFENSARILFTNFGDRVKFLKHLFILMLCNALLRSWNLSMVYAGNSGLHSLEVVFPPHNSSDAGSNPAEVEFLRTEKFREQVLREGLQAV
jgi:hypothetical protein